VCFCVVVTQSAVVQSDSATIVVNSATTIGETIAHSEIAQGQPGICRHGKGTNRITSVDGDIAGFTVHDQTIGVTYGRQGSGERDGGSTANVKGTSLLASECIGLFDGSAQGAEVAGSGAGCIACAGITGIARVINDEGLGQHQA